MDEIKLSDDVIEQIKDFGSLTEKQELLINKLISNEELKKRYREYGLCKKCKQPNTDKYYVKEYGWCQSCNANHFQQSFKNWTSGNHDIDEFIQNAQLKAKNHREVLEWIDYDKFENIEYLAKGGFGTTYKAIWKDGFIVYWDFENNQWKRYKRGDFTVALKCLHDSKDVTAEFLRRIELHIMSKSYFMNQFYGITHDPKTNNFMMVIEYAKNGSLRQHLNNSFNSLSWKEKLHILQKIAVGLGNIHHNGLIHHNFHSGNVLSNLSIDASIADLGLYQPANLKASQSENKKIYGVLPYVAPEVLSGKEFTQASDIYGFGIIAYEVCTGLPPYHDIEHEEPLAIRICNGQRPKTSYKIPQLILDLIKQCWDADPLERPKAEELSELLWNLYSDDDENSTINKQIRDADEINEKSSSSTASSTDILSYTTHPQAVYTSRLLNFENLPEPKNSDGE